MSTLGHSLNLRKSEAKALMSSILRVPKRPERLGYYLKNKRTKIHRLLGNEAPKRKEGIKEMKLSFIGENRETETEFPCDGM